MAYAQLARSFPLVAPDLSVVASHLAVTLQAKGFQVHKDVISTGGWYVSITNEQTFKKTLGMRTGLNVELEPALNATDVEAHVGIFAQRFVPALVQYVVHWPTLQTQIWDAAKVLGIDQIVLTTVEEALRMHGQPADMLKPQAPHRVVLKFCPNCGAGLGLPSKFCSECGANLAELA